MRLYALSPSAAAPTVATKSNLLKLFSSPQRDCSTFSQATFSLFVNRSINSRSGLPVPSSNWSTYCFIFIQK